MLLQMPILIAMFWFFPSCIELRGESFLWAKNLAAPDVIFTLPFTIPWFGNHVSLFCLLMTVTNIIYTRINMQNQPSSSFDARHVEMDDVPHACDVPVLHIQRLCIRPELLLLSFHCSSPSCRPIFSVHASNEKTRCAPE